MIKKVSPETALIINGRRFVLLYDENFEGNSSCDKCAFKNIICREDSKYNLVHLCDDLQSEQHTFFVEFNP